MTAQRLKAWFRRWSDFDSATSLVGYIGTGITAATGLTIAGVAAWAASTLDWYWAKFQWLGVALVFLTAWLVLSLGLFLIAHAVRVWKKAGSTIIQPGNRILKDAAVVDGSENRPPEFRGRFAENGRNAAFYIEYSFARGGIGASNRWTQPRKVLAF